MTDIMIEILEDGTASIKTSAIKESHHMAADSMLDELADMLGGERIREQNPDNPGARFFKNKQVKRGGKIVTLKS